MRMHSAVVTLAASALSFVMGADLAHAAKFSVNYQVQVLRTSYGIPHVRASDWGGLGYGYGYAFAQDNICVLAREVLVATGTQSRYLGPGANNGNVSSDWVYAMVNSAARVNAGWATLDTETKELMQGYADGYNRYLGDTGPDALAAECRGAAWVRPLDALDVFKVLRKLMVRASTGNFVASLAAAAPPAAPTFGATDEAAAPITLAQAARMLDAAELPDFDAERFGSNAVALGSELTGGSGALLGNPHFPWAGIERFYAVHLTIPGRYDVMGASIYGFPLINIGFNRNVAWSHTVSTGRRFVLRELTLAPGNPRAYVYQGNVVAMQPEVVSVGVLQPGGAVVPVGHTFYQTQFGPVLVIPPAALWSQARAYALTDVNLDNSRAFTMYREMGQARSVDELRQALETHVAMPWVNTIATDHQGNAYYGDITVVPNVTNAQLADVDCKGTAVAQGLSSQRLYTVNGALAKCDPGTDADAPVPGIFGPAKLPGIQRRDYVQNSNDSYWLSNPESRLEGYSKLIGADENLPQGFRTRLGISQVRDRIAGTDGLPGSGFSRQWLQDALFENRHYSPEIMLDGVLTLCDEENHVVNVGGTPVDVTEACQVLDGWDRRNKVASIGPHLWTDFWNRARTAPGLYAVPFNAADPVNTPRNVDLANAALRTRLMSDLATTVKFFADNGIPLGREWGRIQFEVRNGEAIPIHGGSGISGVYNAITPARFSSGVGYTPIAAGSSYIQAVTFMPSGPDARAIVTYSQSTDPANPHYADMTKLFSTSGWVTMPYDEGDIRRDPNLSVLKLSEKR